MDRYLAAKNTMGMASLEEASLIKAARSDPKVFNQLYLAHVRPIYRYIYNKVGEVKQAEDITAQVFLAALESLPRYHHDGHFEAWLYGIARHKLADHYRSRDSELPIDVTGEESDKQDEPLSTIIQVEESQHLSTLIRQLDEQDQELLRLRFIAELSFSEIAKLSDSNIEATKKRFYRLLDYLRKQVELDHD